MSLREKKKHATRDALVAAGLALFTRDGYAATSVEAIAAEAGVSRRTYFRYFPDKEELLFAYDADITAAVLTAVDEAAPDLPPLAVVRQTGHAFAALIDERRELVAAREALVASVPALRARSLAKLRRWELLVAELLATRPGTTRGDATLAAKVGIACVQAAFESWLAAPHTDLAGHVDQAFGRLTELTEDLGTSDSTSIQFSD